MKMQRVYQIVEKETKERVCFSLTETAIVAEWLNEFEDTEWEDSHEIIGTFMSEEEIRRNM